MKTWLCILSRGDAAEPAYDDLYPGDGSVWRFYATDVTGRLGELVSHTDARGRVTTLADFGVEILRDVHGAVRQVLTPSRLADVTVRSAAEYEVCIYPLTERPNFADGRYVPPQATPIRRLTMKRGKDLRELLATGANCRLPCMQKCASLSDISFPLPISSQYRCGD